ncbi:hypothetical protein D3C87_1040340 [compost metagenome]
MRRDGALAHLRLVVAGEGAVLGLAQLLPQLAVQARAHAGEIAGVFHPADGVDAKAVVVDRQHPADRLDAPVGCDARVGHHAQRRQHGAGHAAEGAAVFERADRGDRHAGLGALEAHVGHLTHERHELRAAEAAVQHGHVEGVGHVLVVLQPVARNDLRPAAADAVAVGFQGLAVVHGFEAVVAWQHGLLLGRAEVGPDQAVLLLHRVPGLAHAAAAARTAIGFAGLVDAVALHVEHPAVVAAADAFFFHAPVVERRSAVRAAPVHEARATFLVAEQDEVFAQHAHLARRVGGVGGQADGVPVAAQQLAHGRAGADLGQLGFVARRLAAVGGTGVEGDGLPLGGGGRRDNGAHSGVTPAALIRSATRGKSAL